MKLVAAMAASAPTPATRQQLDDCVCLACGCLCDDLRLKLAANHIVGLEPPCKLAEAWYLADRPSTLPICRIDGKPTNLSLGVERGAHLLANARRPLIFGTAGATCEAQRIAVSLADRFQGRIDVAPGKSAIAASAIRSEGLVTATLGEVRHRADLVLFWCADPASTHPRHFERYSLTCAGTFVPRGRADRFCIVIDSRRTPTAEAADEFYEIRQGSELIALDIIASLAGGDATEELAAKAGSTGVELQRWQALVSRIKASRYGAVFFQPNETTERLLNFARTINRHSRFVALPLGTPGNAAGGQQVLAWQSGYCSSVDFAARYPQSSSEFISADALLKVGEVDAALLLTCDPLNDPIAQLSAQAREQLASIPTVTLHTSDYQLRFVSTVAFTIATPGIDSAGTVFRSDGVALPVRAAIDSPYPTGETVLREIEQKTLGV